MTLTASVPSARYQGGSSASTTYAVGGIARTIEAGSGLHAGPLWSFTEAIEVGRLVHVLPDWTPPTYPAHALYKPGGFLPAKIRRFVDLLSVRDLAP